MNYKPKICARCGEVFILNSNNQKYCIKCGPIVKKERIRELCKEYYKKNKKGWTEKYCAKWRKENPEKHKQSKVKWRKNNPEKYKQSNAKCIAKRRKLDFIPLNEFFIGAEAHHIDKTYVIYMPKKEHHKVPHSVLKNINMDEINAVAFNYL